VKEDSCRIALQLSRRDTFGFRSINLPVKPDRTRFTYSSGASMRRPSRLERRKVNSTGRFIKGGIERGGCTIPGDAGVSISELRNAGLQIPVIETGD